LNKIFISGLGTLPRKFFFLLGARKFSGKVLDAQQMKPLIEASVWTTKARQRGTVTDQNGDFTISNYLLRSYILQKHLIGFMSP